MIETKSDCDCAYCLLPRLERERKLADELKANAYAIIRAWEDARR